MKAHHARSGTAQLQQQRCRQPLAPSLCLAPRAQQCRGFHFAAQGLPAATQQQQQQQQQHHIMLAGATMMAACPGPAGCGRRPIVSCAALPPRSGRLLVGHTARRPSFTPTLMSLSGGSSSSSSTTTTSTSTSTKNSNNTTTATCATGGSSNSSSEGRSLSSNGSSTASPSGSSSTPSSAPASPALSRTHHHKGDKSVAASATASVSASLWSRDDEDEHDVDVAHAHKNNGAAVAASGTTAAAAAARALDAMQQQIDAWAASATTKQAEKQQQQATAVQQEGSGEEGLGWRRRWTMVLLCFFAFILCNMDRVNMAVAILPMSAQYGWQPATQGLIQSAFFWGYLCTQILGGVWAAKFGGKLVLGLGVAWWSVATAITPFAAQAGLPVLMVARALMGVGEGVAMPAMNQLLSKWVPSTERSRSLSLVYSGMFMGSMIGLTLSPQVINAFGWPSVFVSFGSLGLFWLLAWTTLAAASPNQDPRCSPAERAFIAAHGAGAPVDVHSSSHGSSSKSKPRVATKAAASSAATAASGVHVEPAAAVAADRPVNYDGAEAASVENIPWRLLLSRKEVWAIILSHFCHNWGTFILLTWMPSYYNQVLGLDLASSGTLSCLPWATMAVSANVGGWLADWAISKGATITTVRKVMQTIGFLGPAFFLGQLTHVEGVMGAVVCMMGAQGCDAFSQSGLYSNHQDIAPRYAGVLLGLSNTAGVLAGVLGSLVTGFILQHGTWDQVWQVAIALYLVGTCIWNAWATGEKVID